MHEMGIASSVLEAVQEELLRYPLHRAAKVGLRIGEYAGVDADSLRFCFEALVAGSNLQPLELEIEMRSDGDGIGGGDELQFGFLELEELEPAFAPAPCIPPGRIGGRLWHEYEPGCSGKESPH